MRAKRFVVAAAVLGIAITAHAGPEGTVDLHFGASGRIFTPLDGPYSSGRAAARQADGKLVVVADVGFLAGHDFGVLRYLADGSLDPTFGVGGQVATDIAGESDDPRAVAIQADGRIVVAGLVTVGSSFGFGVVRYLSDGTVDTGFGSGGHVVTSPTGADSPTAMAIQPDGRIVVGGYSQNVQGWLLVRYLPDGTLDPSFGTGGIVQNPPDSGLSSLAIQADGKIVATGGGAGYDVARYLPDGTLDPTFGTGGLAASSVATTRKVVIEADGTLVIGGAGVALLDTDGNVIAQNSFAGAVSHLLVQGDGSLVYENGGVGRLNPDLTPDASFGLNGSFPSGFYPVTDLNPEADGAVLALGAWGFGGDTGLVRLFAGRCGNGVVEPGEECDDGNTAPGDGCDPNCCLLDSDGDGACDSNDPCTGGTAPTTAKVVVSKLALLATPRVSLSGQVVFPHPFSPPLDPIAHGLHLRVVDASGYGLDLVAEPGAYDHSVRRGWKVNAPGTKWTWVARNYVQRSFAPGGIVQIAVQDRSMVTPGLVKITATGSQALYAQWKDHLPLSFEVVVDTPTATTQCTLAQFPGPSPAPSCVYDTVRQRIVCQ